MSGPRGRSLSQLLVERHQLEVVEVIHPVRRLEILLEILGTFHLPFEVVHLPLVRFRSGLVAGVNDISDLLRLQSEDPPCPLRALELASDLREAVADRSPRGLLDLSVELRQKLLETVLKCPVPPQLIR